MTARPSISAMLNGGELSHVAPVKSGIVPLCAEASEAAVNASVAPAIRRGIAFMALADFRPSAPTHHSKGGSPGLFQRLS